MVRANADNAPATNKKLPVAFFSGEKDACMGGNKSLESAAGLLKNAGYADVSIKLYPDMAHEILNEKDKQIVYDDMVAKINSWLIR